MIEGTTERGAAARSAAEGQKAALQLVDVRVIDHMVVTAGDVVSFAERGLL